MEMQLRMFALVAEGWKAAGETNILSTFCSSYFDLTKPHLMIPRYNIVDIPGCVPHNQPNERNMLEIKGTSHFPGCINLGQVPGQMLNIEFPKLIYTNSTERCTVE